MRLDTDSSRSYTSIYLNNSSQNEWVRETHNYTSSTWLVNSALTMKCSVWLLLDVLGFLLLKWEKQDWVFGKFYVLRLGMRKCNPTSLIFTFLCFIQFHIYPAEYHASDTMKAEETLTTSLTIMSFGRNVLWFFKVNLLILTNTTSLSRLTAKNPCSQVTILISFQIIATLWFHKEITEVELRFCRCAQLSGNIFYCENSNHCTTWECNLWFKMTH